MTEQEADRNALFGVLAVQFNFLTEEQLIEGMQTWLLDKSETLEALLLSQNIMTQTQRDLLSPLVSHHIELHDGDAKKSLIAVSSVSPFVALLKQLENDEISRGLESAHFQSTLIPAETPIADTFIPKNPETAFQQAAITPMAGSRYFSLRPHAKGGLGEVFVAQDTELDREVALKEIQDRYADDFSARARFIMEAEVTGKLEHPGIVPVYGLGAYEDGRPFYAMRFIRGDSFQEAINQFHQECEDSTRGVGSGFETVAFRKLLGRFVDVCQAVGYAHSRGVLHRDLKPGNVMLGTHGETLVVDWGLAKVKGREEIATPSNNDALQISTVSAGDQTRSGSAIGTPGYMSPEQAAGQIDQLGPATDIYGLGAVLYALLSGRGPISGQKLPEILKRTATGDFLKPRELKPQIPKPLEAICLKAMAVAPANRYITCETLAEDVESFLAGEVVSAYPDPWIDRAKRWVRKHRTLATSSVAAVGVGVLGLVIGFAIVTGLNQQLDAKNSQLQMSNYKEQSQRLVAEKRLTQANEVANDLLFVVDLKLKNIAPASAVRRELLNRTEQLLESLLLEAADDPGTLRLRGVQLIRLGEVSLRSGDLTAAKKSWTEAWRISRKLATAEPSNALFQGDVGVALSRLGDIAHIEGDNAQALVYYEEDLSIRRQLASTDPTDPELNRDVAVSLDRMGNVAHAQGNLKQALAYYEESLGITREMIAENTGNAEYQHDLIVPLVRLGNLAKDQGDVKQALNYFEESLGLTRELAASDPTNYELKRDLTVSLERLGDLAYAQGDLKQALAYHEETLGIARTMAAADPENAEFQRDLSISLERLGLIAEVGGDVKQALVYFEECLTIRRDLATADPMYPEGMLISLVKVGASYEATEDWAAAAKHYQEAIDLLNQKILRDEDVLMTKQRLAMLNERIRFVQQAMQKSHPQGTGKP